MFAEGDVFIHAVKFKAEIFPQPKTASCIGLVQIAVLLDYYVDKIHL